MNWLHLPCVVEGAVLSIERDSETRPADDSLLWKWCACSSNHGWSDGPNSDIEALRWSTDTLVGLWEPDVVSSELSNVVASELTVIEHAGSDNLDGFSSGAMSSGHLHIHLRDGSAKSVVSVLLVHVNSSCSSQVSKENAVVSEAGRLLLEDFTGGDDFALDLSDLVLALHVVPELGASNDSVAFEHTHSVKLWVRVSFGGQGTTHNVELSNLCK